MPERPETARTVQEVASRSERPARGPRPPGTIDLSSGDPDFPTPPHVREAMAAAVAADYSNYPPANGDPDLLAAIAARVGRAAGVPWDPADLLVTAGATGAIFAAMAAYLNPGDAVLLPQPTYSLYADVARCLGAEVVWVDPGPGFGLDPDALRAAACRVGARAKLLVLNTPNNPTGALYGRAELEAAASVAAEFGLLVLADEVYDELVFDGAPVASTLALPALHDRLLYCQSLSKTYAMTGWRLGYVAAAAGLLPPIARVARLTGGVNWAVQRAGIAALTGPDGPTRAMRDEYAARRDLVGDLLAGADGLAWTPPRAAFYAFVRYDAPVPARQMAAILRQRGVLVRSGTEYGPGGEGHVRLAFATDRASLAAGVRRARAVLEEAAAGRRPAPIVPG